MGHVGGATVTGTGIGEMGGGGVTVVVGGGGTGDGNGGGSVNVGNGVTGGTVGTCATLGSATVTIRTAKTRHKASRHPRPAMPPSKIAAIKDLCRGIHGPFPLARCGAIPVSGGRPAKRNRMD